MVLKCRVKILAYRRNIQYLKVSAVKSILIKHY